MPASSYSQRERQTKARSVLCLASVETSRRCDGDEGAAGIVSLPPLAPTISSAQTSSSLSWKKTYLSDREGLLCVRRPEEGGKDEERDGPERQVSAHCSKLSLQKQTGSSRTAEGRRD